MAHQSLWNADEYSLQLNSAQECNYPETPPQEAQRPHHDYADMDPEAPGSLEDNDGDSSTGNSKINGGEEAKKIDGPPCGSSVSKGFTVSKLNAKAPEFIPRGPLSPLQAPTTPPMLQPQQTRPVVSQPLPRLMIPQSPRPQALQVYSAGSPRMPVQFPTSPAQVGQASFSASRPLAHGSSPHHSPGGGGLVEYYAEHEASDAENTGSAASSSLAKGAVLTEEPRQKIVRQPSRLSHLSAGLPSPGLSSSPEDAFCPRGICSITPSCDLCGGDSAPKSQYQIFIKALDGKTIILWVGDLEQVSEVKEKIQYVTGISAQKPTLIYSGKALQEKFKLHEYPIQRNTTVFFNLRLRGGAPGETSSDRPAPTGKGYKIQKMAGIWPLFLMLFSNCLERVLQLHFLFLNARSCNMIY